MRLPAAKTKPPAAIGKTFPPRRAACIILRAQPARALAQTFRRPGEEDSKQS
jgi:hypothetical protein